MKKAAKVYFTDFRCTGDENLQAKFTRLMKAAGIGMPASERRPTRSCASDHVAFPFTPTVTLSHIDLPIVTSA